ncbi:MAG: Flp pilus assembly complex ATPase component TadA [Lentisphaeria bacterium]|nr:Flp pilus assembly complex ATPase component TadA [Lentisphaeria bacterium]
MYLIIKGRSESFRSVSLDGEKSSWLIGRDPNCDIVLKASQISRRHAMISLEDGEFFIEDCNSSLGVFVNESKITEKTKIAVGNLIRLCSYELLLSFEDVEEEESPDESEQTVMISDIQKFRGAFFNQGRFQSEYKSVNLLYTDEMMKLKKRIHEKILSEMNLPAIHVRDLAKAETRVRLDRVLTRVMREFWHEIPRNISPEIFKEGIVDELINYGPISPLLRADDITEVMINGPDLIFVEHEGKLFETGIRFFNDQHLLSVIQRIVEPLGRHIDEASPMVDARLPDGSRVNAIIPPLAIDGALVTIRKFAKNKLTTEDLIDYGSLTDEMAQFLSFAVKYKQNIIISGGTGSGKTTLLNVLSQFIPLDERLVTIEDSAELKLTHRNLARLESRTANIEGKGKVSIRDLLVNALRMRPDRIIIGECRSGEALDMLQAMNTGHDGALTTVHANSPRDSLSRLENMVLMAGVELPVSSIREQVASAINFVVQQSRLGDGSRKITQVTEITGREGNTILMQDIFVWKQEGVDESGKFYGHFEATGHIPKFVSALRERGVLDIDMSLFAKGEKI